MQVNVFEWVIVERVLVERVIFEHVLVEPVIVEANRLVIRAGGSGGGRGRYGAGSTRPIGHLRR